MSEQEQFEKYSKQFLEEVAAKPEGSHPPSQLERVNRLAKDWLFGREPEWILWEKPTKNGAVQKRVIRVGDVFIDGACSVGRTLYYDSIGYYKRRDERGS